MGVKKNCVQGVGGAAAGEGIGGGAPYKKMGIQIYIYINIYFTAIQRAQRALQVAEGHQLSAGARSRCP